MMRQIVPRPYQLDPACLPSDWHALIKSIYATRLHDKTQIDKPLKALPKPSELLDMDKASQAIAHWLANKTPITIYGDYDVDGATATAMMVKVLRQLGGVVEWFIPKREQHGYGFSVAGLAELSAKCQAIITVDNGITSHEAVALANARGISVIITDHHTPKDTLPDALAVINPKRADNPPTLCNLSGVGVAFYLLLGLQKHLKHQARWPSTLSLTTLLDLVAFGTVADLVALDYPNRILVEHGLRRIREGKAQLGIGALAASANLDLAHISAKDIAFSLAPRLNALGRLGSMSEGVSLLLAQDWQTAQELAEFAEATNRKRKALENQITNQALAIAMADKAIVSAYQADWHEGVIGIVAARLKSHYQQPVLVATDGIAPYIKASLRSVEGVALNALLAHAKAHTPELDWEYGGHAMAAGLRVTKEGFPKLLQALESSYQALISTPPALSPIYSDGELPETMISLDWARHLEHLEPWGQNLPTPIFHNKFIVLDCRTLGKAHRRLLLEAPESGHRYNASWFFSTCNLAKGSRIELVYELEVNRFYGDERLHLLAHHVFSY